MPPLMMTPDSKKHSSLEDNSFDSLQDSVSRDTYSVPLPQKSFWQLVNLSIGFLGIQFGWAI
ncbi:MAG: hypothetical protein K2X66_19220, partial [Cyanobacteria bacterium]|nr:hypothetical protein [Cyanobacteriota bacterium]